MELLLIIIGVTIIFFAISLRHIPADPPHIAVVTLLGQRLRKIKGEGYRLFPFYPVIYNAVLIDVSKKNQDLPPQGVRSRDLAEFEISVSLTWSPNPDYAIEYLNHGSENGVRNILADMVNQRLREWAITTNWEDALKAHDKTTAILVKTIAGLPTELSKEEQEKIIARIAQGDGVQPIPQLGIILNRLNIKEIKPKGELIRAAELLVKEKMERVGERIEMQHAMDRVQEVKKVLGCSTAQAIELFQTERGKVVKKINEIKGSVSDETRKMVERIIDQIWQKKQG